MKLKTYKDFLNESFTADYLVTIVNKLKSEGKTNEAIYAYLDILNIPKAKIMGALASCGCIQESLNEDEESLDDLLSGADDDTEDEKEKEDPTEDEKESDDAPEADTEAKKTALQNAVNDIEKMAKIKGIVKKDDEEDAEKSKKSEKKDDEEEDSDELDI